MYIDKHLAGCISVGDSQENSSCIEACVLHEPYVPYSRLFVPEIPSHFAYIINVPITPGSFQLVYKHVHAHLLQSCPTLFNPMDYSPPGSSVHGDSPGKNIRVSCHALLQGIFPNQGVNLSPVSFIGRWDLYYWGPLCTNTPVSNPPR